MHVAVFDAQFEALGIVSALCYPLPISEHRSVQKKPHLPETFDETKNLTTRFEAVEDGEAGRGILFLFFSCLFITNKALTIGW